MVFENVFSFMCPPVIANPLEVFATGHDGASRRGACGAGRLLQLRGFAICVSISERGDVFIFGTLKKASPNGIQFARCCPLFGTVVGTYKNHHLAAIW